MAQTYFSNSTSTRNEIQCLETFSTEQLVAEVQRRRSEMHRVPNYTRVLELETAPEIMTPELFNKKLEHMMNLSLSAFSIRVSLNCETEGNTHFSSAINKIISDDCYSYQNRMNDLLLHDKQQYFVLRNPDHIEAFLRLQESELGALEEHYSKKTVASIIPLKLLMRQALGEFN